MDSEITITGINKGHIVKSDHENFFYIINLEDPKEVGLIILFFGDKDECRIPVEEFDELDDYTIEIFKVNKDAIYQVSNPYVFQFHNGINIDISESYKDPIPLESLRPMSALAIYKLMLIKNKNALEKRGIDVDGIVKKINNMIKLN